MCFTSSVCYVCSTEEVDVPRFDRTVFTSSNDAPLLTVKEEYYHVVGVVVIYYNGVFSWCRRLDLFVIVLIEHCHVLWSSFGFWVIIAGRGK